MEKKFETGDLWLSAFLMTCGLSPALLTRSGRVLFSFPASPDLDTLLVNFQNNCNVRVLDFAEAAKTLRGQMLDLKHNGQAGGRHG